MLLPLLLAACTFIPRARVVPRPDTGFVTPDEYTQAGRLQVGTFNTEWLASQIEQGYTPREPIDYQMIGKLIADFDLDLMALEEVNTGAAIELLELPERYAWQVGQSGWSQNVAVLYRADLLDVYNVREVQLPQSEWPDKDLLVAEVRVRGTDQAFTFVGLHFKAYSDSASASERQAQVEGMHDWLTLGLPAETEPPYSDHVIVAGDFNDTFAGTNGNIDTLQVFEDDPAWHFATQTTTAPTTLGGSTIDHILLSEAMWDTIPDAPANVIEHDHISPWRDYDGGYGGQVNISDHRPVWVYVSAP